MTEADVRVDEDEAEDEAAVVDEVDEQDEPLRTENWVESRRDVSGVYQGNVDCVHDRADVGTVCV